MSADSLPPPAADDEQPSGMRLHMGIAEQGKLYALEGNHARALHYYRTAMQLTVQAGDPEIFFRHYLECVMESLEQTGSLADVLAYCDKAIALYAERPPPNPVAVADLASIHQRRGVILLKLGEVAEARAAFRNALAVAQGAGRALALAQTLQRWLDAGFHVDPARVLAEQKRTEYFSVRRDTVAPQRAVRLVDEGGPQLGGRRSQ
jgi:tetratricopeptide (TPR) repeat protein